MSNTVMHSPEESIADTKNDVDNISICSHSSTSSSQSCHSESSTIQYSQESWEYFKPRVEEICRTLWSPRQTFIQLLAKNLRTNRLLRSLMPPPQTPIVERLRGGDYNRITGITLPYTHSRGIQKLILRTSRSDEGRPDQESAVLDYLRQRSSIPVPEIIAKDVGYENALGKPYVIQNRISGSDLNSIWDTLSHTQKCTIACELGKVLKNLLSLESLIPGTIEAMPPGDDLAHGPIIVPFEMRDPGEGLIEEPVQETSSNTGTFPIGQTTGDFLKHRFGRWKAYALERPFDRITNLFTDLLDTVTEMDDLGLFDTGMHCLCHVDLHSRNIMAEVQSNDSIKITAILDWDEAIIAPKFVNCQPPWWLWEEEGDERVDEDGVFPWPYELEAAKDFPSTPEKKELKSLFEEHAGPQWRALAYDELSRLSRGLFVLAKEGLPASEHFKAAERILREWKILRQSLVSQRA